VWVANSQTHRHAPDWHIVLNSEMPLGIDVSKADMIGNVTRLTRRGMAQTVASVAVSCP
jgi:hypothetical protein